MRSMSLIAAVAVAMAAMEARAEERALFHPGRCQHASITVLPDPGHAPAMLSASIAAFIDAWPRDGTADPGSSIEAELSFGRRPLFGFVFANSFAILLDRSSIDPRYRTDSTGPETILYRDSVLVETIELTLAFGFGAGARFEAEAGSGWALSFSAAAGGLFRGDSAEPMARAGAEARWSSTGIEIRFGLAADVTASGIARMGAGAGAVVRF